MIIFWFVRYAFRIDFMPLKGNCSLLLKLAVRMVKNKIKPIL